LTRRKIYCRIRRHKGNGVFERKLEGAFFYRISGHRDEGKGVFCVIAKGVSAFSYLQISRIWFGGVGFD
jgi:hypothetical protein